MWINGNEIAKDGIDNDKNGYRDDYYGYDFCNDKGYCCKTLEQINENGHGTMCAGIIAASGDKNGISGVASCIDVKIMSLKVLDSANSTNTNRYSKMYGYYYGKANYTGVKSTHTFYVHNYFA